MHIELSLDTKVNFGLSMCRIYSAFTLESIVATAFGRQINLQRGESDDLTRAMDVIVKGLSSGCFETLILLNSMP